MRSASKRDARAAARRQRYTAAMKIKALIAAFCIGLSGCAAAPQPPAALTDVDTRCEDPRPEACTRDYRPVCALRDTGIRCVTIPCPSTEWKTYGNACDACSDADVIGHLPGACDAN